MKRRLCIIVEETDDGGHAGIQAEELQEQTSIQMRTKGTTEIRQSEGIEVEEEEKYF